jgi:hypothetical protein
MREERKLYKVLVGKPEGKRPLGRPRRRWDQNVLYCYGDWLGGRVGSVGSGYRPVAGSCEYGDKPSSSGTTESFSYIFILTRQ